MSSYPVCSKHVHLSGAKSMELQSISLARKLLEAFSTAIVRRLIPYAWALPLSLPIKRMIFGNGILHQMTMNHLFVCKHTLHMFADSYWPLASAYAAVNGKMSGEKWLFLFGASYATAKRRRRGRKMFLNVSMGSDNETNDNFTNVKRHVNDCAIRVNLWLLNERCDATNVIRPHFNTIPALHSYNVSFISGDKIFPLFVCVCNGNYIHSPGIVSNILHEALN